MRRPTLSSVSEGFPEDSSIEELSGPIRSRIANVWQDRANNELAAAARFATLARFAVTSGAIDTVQWGCTHAVSDEMRHSVLCHAIANRYSTTPLPWPTPTRSSSSPADFPQPLVAPLQLVTTCCIQETVGAVFLEHALNKAEGPLARHGLFQLLTDEVGHGQLGWAYLESASDALRDSIREHVPTLLSGSRMAWDARIHALPELSNPAHGSPEREEARSVVSDAFSRVVLPGFRRFGFRVG